MHVIWLEDASEDLGEIHGYIAQRNPAAATRIVERIVTAVARLATGPNLGRPGRVSGTRELVIRGTPYIVPYRITGQNIEILRVYHGARQWPDRFQD